MVDHGDAFNRARISGASRSPIGSPSRLMLIAWALFVLIYLLGPVEMLRIPRAQTWATVSVCIVAFFCGCAITRRPHGPLARRGIPEADVNRLTKTIRLCAMAGLAGGACIVIDKLWFSGIDYNEGITAARLEGAREGVRYYSSYARSLLLYPGILTYSMSIVSLMLWVLRAEVLPMRLLYLSCFSLMSPLVVAALYGGRSNFLIAPSMILGAVIIRSAASPVAMNRRKIVAVLGVTILASLLYNSYILQERRTFFGFSEFERELEYIETVGGYGTKPWMLTLMRSSVLPADFGMAIINLNIYLLHGVSTLDVLVEHSKDIGPYWGQYQVGVLGSFLERYIQQLSVLQQMYDVLGDLNVLAVFATAWGALLADFGWTGMLLSAFAWGWFTQRLWNRAVTHRSLAAELCTCFLIVSVLISPMHSIVGFGSGVFLLLDVLVVACSLIVWRPVAVAARGVSAGARGRVGTVSPHELHRRSRPTADWG